MKQFIIVAAALLLGVVLAADHCSPYLTCTDCISQPLCGWCSEDVVYPGNISGAQCAGFNSNGSTPFACNGIYSTEQCVQGYVCNKTTFTCELGEPGQGGTQAQCEADCINNGDVYLCNETTSQCEKVSNLQPNNGSYAVCMAACTHPSSHPSSSSPAPPPTPQALYACNYTSGQCVSSTAGKGESLSACEQNCQKTNVSYMCNSFLQKCVELPPGVKGETLAECENVCQVKPVPGPPSGVSGVYRGLQISNNYATGEFDLFINETIVIFIGHIQGGSIISTMIGTPLHIPNSNDLEMWIDVTSGPGAGQTVKTISDASGSNGPETSFLTMAMSSPGAAVPTSLFSAMTAPEQVVFAFSKCLDVNCNFTMRGGSSVFRKVLTRLSDSDHCSQFGDSCTDCLSHEYCGWCSVDVVYKDGSQGTQCAGFNGLNSSNAFVCAGRYSTLSCDVGYICNYTSLQCQQTTPGNGMPQAECEALCHATPPPTPAQDMYTCNTTTKQCIKCNLTHCPGEMPLGQCEAACTNPKPGPHGNLIGVWRGIRIQNGYKVGEVEAVFTNTTASFYTAKVLQFTANVTSLGADLMILDVLTGTYQGWKLSAIYQESSEGLGLYGAITFAKGIYGQGPPSSYAQAMYTPPMEEYVYYKCNESPCSFAQP
eukprot:CAMPEP_0176421600 /NCGR_PEP_ID=MMETSP0127-20121128/9266_1 /TAXON_ID=938130 /ORGANISM="Platyophrya macrostoma, Strain WH" /LENGTH=653 /DNA_ID=CAMNT_0017802353 /DNA_START=111 /DNA_END=2072 /DNA_ORIENTATION=+